MAVHVLCSGPSTLDWIKPSRDWSTKDVILCNGMPLVWGAWADKPCHTLKWCMIDPLPEMMLGWGTRPCPYPRFCTRLNQHQVKGCEVVRHNVSAVMDEPLKDGFYWQGSVGHLGCQIARLYGAYKVYVWGLDYQSKERSYSNIHGSLQSKEKSWDMQIIETGWERLRNGLYDLGVRVYNCNPKTNLKALEIMDPEQALAED